MQPDPTPPPPSTDAPPPDAPQSPPEMTVSAAGRQYTIPLDTMARRHTEGLTTSLLDAIQREGVARGAVDTLASELAREVANHAQAAAEWDAERTALLAQIARLQGELAGAEPESVDDAATPDAAAKAKPSATPRRRRESPGDAAAPTP